MRFYMSVLSVYSALATVLLVILAQQNVRLKTRPATSAIDWQRVHAVEPGNAPRLGQPDAPVRVTLFADFQCAACRLGYRTLTDLERQYRGLINLTFKNLALPQHPSAVPAAKAALAAGVQGKFWEMADLLFAQQDELGEAFFKEAANRLGLDAEAFGEDLHLAIWADQLAEDREQAKRLGLTATPVFFVNGIMIPGFDEATLRNAIARFMPVVEASAL